MRYICYISSEGVLAMAETRLKPRTVIENCEIPDKYHRTIKKRFSAAIAASTQITYFTHNCSVLLDVHL